MDARESFPCLRATAPAVARHILFSLLAAAGPFFTAAPAARAGEDLADDASARVSVFLDSSSVREFDLSRTDAAERVVYDLSLDIPGVKAPLTARVPLEAGQTNTTLSLTVRERENRHASSLALAGGSIPPLPLGLFSGTDVQVDLVRTDASSDATYSIVPANAADAAFALDSADTPFSLSAASVSFAAGQTSAAFTVRANRSRAEKLELRIVRDDDSADRLRLVLPVVRGPIASFENNFYVCFIKEIPFGTQKVRGPDGSIRYEQVYKGRWHYITNGLRNTLTVALCAVLLGAILGFLTAIVRYTHDKHGHFALLDAVCKVYITVIRGTPMTVQLLIAYFIIFSNLNNKVLVAILAFGFNSGAYVAEIIRAGIVSIDAGQMEAARSLGLSYAQGMRKIVLPQAIRNILPALGNEFIVMLKDTSIASFIGLDDLARGGSIIRSQTYQAYIPFLAVAAIYLVLVMIFSKLLARLEKRLHRSSR
ncbi:MAG: amino acid ABC transporter permease [Kiritimatiellae bacterium]|nr:amino acid ABC transporter permease [Kiritimatiellia bacterium]